MKYLIKRALLVCALLAAPGAALAAEGYATANVNLRSGPSTAYPPVVVVPVGSSLDVYGCLAETPWCDVSYGRIRGWMSGKYIQTVYRERRVRVDPEYYRPLGIPIIRFDLDNYWERNYRGRDFYRDRDRWRREWRGGPNMGRDRDRPRRDRWNDNDSGWGQNDGWNDDFGNRPRRDRDRDNGQWGGQWGGGQWDDGGNGNNRPHRPRPGEGQNNGGQWGGNPGDGGQGNNRPHRPRPGDGQNNGGQWGGNPGDGGQGNNRPHRPRPGDGQNNGGQWGGNPGDDGQGNNRPHRPRPGDGQNNGGQWGGNPGDDGQGNVRPPRPRPGGNQVDGGQWGGNPSDDHRGNVRPPRPGGDQVDGGGARPRPEAGGMPTMCSRTTHDGNTVRLPCGQ